MAGVAASDIQKNFGEWHDRAMEAPVAISRDGKTTAYLVSSDLFEQVMASYRRSVAVEKLSPTEIELISGASIAEGEPYDLDDIPEHHGQAPQTTL